MKCRISLGWLWIAMVWALTRAEQAEKLRLVSRRMIGLKLFRWCMQTGLVIEQFRRIVCGPVRKVERSKPQGCSRVLWKLRAVWSYRYYANRVLPVISMIGVLPSCVKLLQFRFGRVTSVRGLPRNTVVMIMAGMLPPMPLKVRSRPLVTRKLT